MFKLSKKIIAIFFTTLLLSSSLFCYASDDGLDNGWRASLVVVESRQF